MPMPGEALERSHRQMVKAYSSGSVFLILPYRLLGGGGRGEI